MTEYLSEAIVLSKESSGDADVRVVLFTKRYGKLVAKAKSARKITSKLAAHLEPGVRARIRVIEKNGPQVVDALEEGKVMCAPHELRVLGGLLSDLEPEHALYHALAHGTFEWRTALRTLGWDPLYASCFSCHTRTPSYFDPHTQDFFCDACALKKPADALLLDVREYDI